MSHCSYRVNYSFKYRRWFIQHWLNRWAFCETQWPRPPLFSPSWLIQWSMMEGYYITLFSPSDVRAFHRMKYGEGVLYSPVFTEWRHCVSQNTYLYLYNLLGISWHTSGPHGWGVKRRSPVCVNGMLQNNYINLVMINIVQTTKVAVTLIARDHIKNNTSKTRATKRFLSFGGSDFNPSLLNIILRKKARLNKWIYVWKNTWMNEWMNQRNNEKK